MGQWVTYCTGENCLTKHRSQKSTQIEDWKLFVLKSPSLVFMKPTISSLHIDDDVIQKWLNMSQTLHAWSRLLKSTQNTVKEETYANHDNIMIET